MSQKTISREREPWMCVDCFENPGDRGVTGYVNNEVDGVEVCGYHYGKRKGYLSEKADENDGGPDA